MIPQRVPNPFNELVGDQLCAIADRWGLEPDLVQALINARGELPFDIWIFSGSRSRSHQGQISRTPFALSTHADEDETGCPRLSTGADVQPVDIANRMTRAPSIETAVFLPVAQFGAAMTRARLRWGGGAPTNPDTGFPAGVEVWHVDMGPRG